MNSYIFLLKRALQIFFGNIGSKLIQFLIIPYYTKVLTPEQYGEMDIYLGTSQLIMTIISLQISEAVFRYTKESNLQIKNNILKMILKYNILLNIFLIGIGIFIKPYIQLNIIKNNLYYFIFFMTTTIFLENIKQFIRGLEKIKLYSLSGFLESSIFIIFNILLIKKYGIMSFFISRVFSNILILLFIIIFGRLDFFLLKKQKKQLLYKEILKYSFPFIPNALMLWFLNLSDRYILMYYQGYEATGIYSIANKIPLILSSLMSIFFMSWQATAIDECKKKEYEKFYNNLFNIVKILLFFIGLTMCCFIKEVISMVLEKQFIVSWKYVPLLCLGIFFSSFSSYIGVNYIISKKTKYVFLSAGLGGITNIILNLYFTKKYSIYGVSFTTALSYLIVFLIRKYDTSKIVKLKINMFKFFLEIIVFVLYYIIIIKYENNIFIKILGYITSISLLIILNMKTIQSLLLKYNNKIK
ncbi:Membrane protein involved in the export of O-antigen and teichoic acid [Cetobacterium ceti]|uniref:Membrane protein involved in the export of O-antigen and teichoic acid n=1 Tax=Cetobacterium ceti TaxID=180163 RepID=A0A1T4LX58_9FUSO|nr:oligosaccharide flippase family protein [Cetobacterium ceti]SJZ59044.1 Membrane protein involved in the export of O-antigen and teichoic acid [Cetobacterium ceti]